MRIDIGGEERRLSEIEEFFDWEIFVGDILAIVGELYDVAGVDDGGRELLLGDCQVD